MSDTVKGIYFAIIGVFSIAAMGVFVKYIGTDLSSITILFFRFAISLIVLLPFLFRSKTFSFKIKYPYHLTIRVLTGILAMTLYFVAIQHINLVNAILLESAYPIFVPIIIFFLTGQKTNRRVMWGIIVSFIGIIIILQPGTDIFQPYSIVAVLSGICAGIAYVFLKIMLTKDKTQMHNLLFYFFLFGSLIPLPYVIIYWKPLSLFHILCLLGVGVFGYGYQYFITKALQHASVRIVSPLVYVSVLSGGFLDWLLWNTTPSYLTLLGTIITIFGAIIVILNRNKISVEQ
jgi:drug/metabolite transporter (DMT)-like permease